MSSALESNRILETLGKARKRIEQLSQARDQRVAVIGMAGRFPGAETVDELWELVAGGGSGARRLSEEELRRAGVPEELFGRDEYVRSYASFSDPTAFDADFFGYSPGEAATLDPQHRVFLECAWQALEDAGYDSQRFDGRVGIYAGSALNSYLVNLHNDPETRGGVNEVQAVVGNVMGLMPTRVSYHLNLTGPSCGVQTGCSTSLVAVHAACRSLLDGDCEMALAGGVTIGQAKPTGYLYEEGGIASPDGCCRSFDAQGGGTLFGNGVGVVVLKRFNQAQEDGDNIRAVILGSAVNNDGSDKVGLLAPSVSGQATVISAALNRAGVGAETISYIEAHGTATELGDPIEFAAIDQALGNALQQAERRCVIGSVKSNVGHLDAAAGVAGLIKTVMAMEHRTLPPTAHYRSANPRLGLEEKPFSVIDQPVPWDADEGPRRAGVSSFGMGGTNAHVVLEEAPPAENRASHAGVEWCVLPLSARCESSLAERRQSLTESLGALARAEHRLADAAYTLQVGRRAMRHRDVVVCRTLEEAVAGLQRVGSPQLVDTDPSLVFLFSGQGSLTEGAAEGLYKSQPTFRHTLDRCGEILGAPWDRGFQFSAAQGGMQATANAQPTLFAIEYALAKLLMEWGVVPSVMLGHSLGEYVAACLAGVFSLEDALQVVRFRGELMQQQPPGAMLAVAADEAAVEPWLEDGIEIAAINGPKQVVLSGPTPLIELVQQRLGDQSILSQKLATSHAFHSAMMQAAILPLTDHLASIRLSAPDLDIISNVTGGLLTAEQATDPAYWGKHLRRPVQFQKCLAHASALPAPVFLEVGPGRVLSGLAKSQLGASCVTVAPLASPADSSAETRQLVDSVAQLWRQGVAIDWDAFSRWKASPGAYAASPPRRRRVSLPAYPFQRTSHYVPLRDPTTDQAPTAAIDNEAGNRDRQAKLPFDEWFHVPAWRSVLASGAKPPTSAIALADPSWDANLREAFSNTQLNFVRYNGSGSVDKPDLCIDPTSSADYTKLWSNLGNPNEPLRLLHCATVESDHPQHGLLSLVALGQSLLESGQQRSVQLDVLTTGLCDVSGDEQLRSSVGVLPGLLNVLRQEVPGLDCRLIDLGAKGEPAELELIADWGDERLIATRGKRRWGLNHERLPSRLGEEAHNGLLSPMATYAIVGDLLDGLGVVYAEALRRHLEARVILVDTGSAPKPDRWDKWLATHGGRHPTSKLIGRLKALGRMGDDFTMRSADGRSLESLSAAISEALQELDSDHIQGAFYTDVMGGEASCSLRDTDTAAVDRILGKKAATADALVRCLQPLSPSFLLLQSSLSAVVGGRGFAAYAAANSYLDSLAHTRPLNCPVVSVNWDACELEERDAAEGTHLMSAALSPEEVWQATRRVLSTAESPQVIVTPRPLAERLVDDGLHNEGAADAQNAERPDGVGYVAPRTPTEEAVTRALQDLLGIRSIGVHDNFFALGGHSLLAIQAITRLRRELNIDLPMRAILQGTPTAAGIAEVIEQSTPSITEDEFATVESLLDQLEHESAGS